MLVTKASPDFTAPAVLGNNEIVDNFNLYNEIGKNGAVVFFYPKDFTFVCPSEIIAFDKRFNEFKERGITVIGISGDNEFCHFAWKNTPVNQGGIGQVRFPLVADLDRSIARKFDVLYNESVALRGSFLIDAKGKIIRHAIINDLPLGRDVDEMLRVVDMMLFTNEHGEVCPAQWGKGDAGMKADTKGVADYLAKNEEKLAK